MELDTLRRSRTPTVVLAANWEVHTNEEALVYIHDLNRFVTVQLLGETLAVLSFGKVCEDHGYCYDCSRDADDRLRDLPEWVELFTESEGRRMACMRTHFSGLRFRTSYESGIKIKETQYLYSLPKTRKLRSPLANQNDKGSLQKTHWRSSTSSRNVWWLDNGRSQGPPWGG